MTDKEQPWLPMPKEPHGPASAASRSRIRRYFAASIVFVLGINLTGAIYSTVQQNEELRFEHSFDAMADQGVRSLIRTIDRYEQTLLAAHALFDASEFVSRKEFRKFVTPLLHRESGIRAIGWIPRVQAADLASFQDAARKDDYEFTIQNLASDSPSSPRPLPDWYPVFYLEPHNSNEAAFGIDLGSERRRAEALAQAADTTQPAATRPLDLVQDPENAKSTLIVLPHYEVEPPSDETSERRDQLAGFVSMAVRLPDLLRDARSSLDERNVRVALYYGDELVAGQSVDSDESEAGAPPAARYARSENVVLGGRDWTLISIPTEHLLSSQGMSRSYLVLLAGLALTFLSTAYLYATMRSSDISRALEQSELRNRTLVQHAPEAIVLLNAEKGRFVDANENASKMFGYSREQLLKSSLVDISAPIQPDGRTVDDAGRAYVKEAVNGYVPAFVWIHKNSQGREFPCEVRLVRMPSLEDTLIRGSITDITERLQNEERQKLMMRELDHRVKNNLATILSLAEQSAADAESVSELRNLLTGRIRAIADLHRALASNQWADMELRDVLELALAAYEPGEGEHRIRLSGPPCTVPPETCSALCMVFHELATNAVKYGALSNLNGTVNIHWQSEGDGLSIDWDETGGPSIEPPRRSGYGTRLLTGLIEHQLGGRVDTDFAATGLRCRMFVPPAALRGAPYPSEMA